MLVVSPSQIWFRCPGEPYDIPEGVHRARLASGYHKCTDCPHRRQTPDPVDPGRPAAGPLVDTRVDRGRTPVLWHAEGVRGVFLNEFDCRTAQAIAAAFARHLETTRREDRQPAPVNLLAAGDETVLQRLLSVGPVSLMRPNRIVLGHDERRFSPELAAAAGRGLRQMGCDVWDVGLIAKPGMAEVVRAQRAAGGLLVTGAGCAVEFGGCDLWGAEGRPLSSPGELDRVRAEWERPVPMAARAMGSLTSRQVVKPDAARWQPLVHGLRPLRVAWGCGLPQITGELLNRLTLSDCRLMVIESGLGGVEQQRTSERVFAALRETIGLHACHLGVAVAEDRQRCVFLDERGNVLEGAQLLRGINGVGDCAGVCAETLEEAWRRRSEQTGFQLMEGPRDYYWTAGGECDAVLTTLIVMRWLSESDQPLSRRVTEAGVAGGSPVDRVPTVGLHESVG